MTMIRAPPEHAEVRQSLLGGRFGEVAVHGVVAIVGHSVQLHTVALVGHLRHAAPVMALGGVGGDVVVLVPAIASARATVAAGLTYAAGGGCLCASRVRMAARTGSIAPRLAETIRKMAATLTKGCNVKAGDIGDDDDGVE